MKGAGKEQGGSTGGPKENKREQKRVAKEQERAWGINWEHSTAVRRRNIEELEKAASYPTVVALLCCWSMSGTLRRLLLPARSSGRFSSTIHTPIMSVEKLSNSDSTYLKQVVA